MKISKDKALKFSKQDWVFREFAHSNETLSSLLKYSKFKSMVKSYQKDPVSQLCLLMETFVFCNFTESNFRWAKQFYGSRLWYSALELFFVKHNKTKSYFVPLTRSKF